MLYQAKSVSNCKFFRKEFKRGFDKKMRYIGLFTAFCLFIGLYFFLSENKQTQTTNPFVIHFPEKNLLTNDDYIAVQKQLNRLNIDPLIAQLYGSNPNLVPINQFQQRCSKGLTQTLIDPEKNQFPIQKLEKIGSGSDMCIVSCCPYNGVYHNLIQDIPKALKELGFNGYFYHRIGGFPNPTGREIKFAGVPYCFKIFMMVEAQQLGFNKVLWIDSSVIPVNNPEPLFDEIEQNGAFISYCYYPENTCIFPKTRMLLKELTGTDVLKGRHIATQVFGLKMDMPKSKQFINSFYQFVEMGTPFLSRFPEEFVFSSLIEQSPKEWPANYIFQVLRNQESNDIAELEKAKNDGCYFFLRKH